MLVVRASPGRAPGGRPEPRYFPGPVLEATEITEERGKGRGSDGDQVLAGHPIGIGAGAFQEVTGITGDGTVGTAHHHGPLVGALAGMGKHVGLPAGAVDRLYGPVVSGGEPGETGYDRVQVGTGHHLRLGPSGRDVGHRGAEPGVKAGVLVAELSVQIDIGRIEGAYGHTVAAFLSQELAHQGPGHAPAPVLGQDGHGADAGARDQLAPQPLAEGDGVGDAHDLLAGIGAQASPAVEGHVVRSGLHVEGQGANRGYPGPVGFGGSTDLEHVPNLPRCSRPRNVFKRPGPSPVGAVPGRATPAGHLRLVHGPRALFRRQRAGVGTPLCLFVLIRCFVGLLSPRGAGCSRRSSSNHTRCRSRSCSGLIG